MTSDGRDVVEVYMSAKDRQWHWRRKAAGNHEIIASGEAYHNRSDAVHTASRIAGRECHLVVLDGIPIEEGDSL